MRSAICVNCSINNIAHALGGELGDNRDKPRHDHRREAERQFVSQNIAWAIDDRLSQHDHLLLAARQRSRARGKFFTQFRECRERGFDSFFRAWRRPNGGRRPADCRAPTNRLERDGLREPPPRQGRRHLFGPKPGDRPSVDEDRGAAEAGKPPAIARTSELLPAPLAPSSAVMRPGGISRSMPANHFLAGHARRPAARYGWNRSCRFPEIGRAHFWILERRLYGAKGDHRATNRSTSVLLQVAEMRSTS